MQRDGCDRECVCGEGEEGMDVGVWWWGGDVGVGVGKERDTGWKSAVVERLGSGSDVVRGIRGSSTSKVNPCMLVLEEEIQRAGLRTKLFIVHVMGMPGVVGVVMKGVGVSRLV